MTITVIAETQNDELTLATLECLAEAGEVATKLELALQVVLPGYGVAALANTLAAYGADRVTLVEHEALSHFTAAGWLIALEPVLKETAPLLLLAPDTGYSRAWLPRLAARWRAPLISGCNRLKVNATGKIEMIRPIYGGAQQEQLICPQTTTIVATLLPGVRGISSPGPMHQVKVTHLKPALNSVDWADRTLRRLPPDPRTVDIGEAERIVAGGLGIGRPKGLDMLWQLADVLQAAVGGTRVISDRGWLANDRFIGATGKTVSPKLYIALGISGASQHTAGLSGQETVIAVNIDRAAPIFKLADLGIVGDLYEVVPALLDKLTA